MHFLRQAAYLDPGTGSVVIQAIIGVVLGGAVVLRSKLRSLYNKLTGKKRADAKKEIDL